MVALTTPCSWGSVLLRHRRDPRKDRGVDGAALVGLWIKGQRERAVARLQAAWRTWRAQFTPARWWHRRFQRELPPGVEWLGGDTDALHLAVRVGTVEHWDVNALYPLPLLGVDVD